MAPPVTPALVRFMRYVSPEPNTGCWLWTGTTIFSRGGRMEYGRFSRQNGQAVRAHRAALEMFVRMPAPGECALHRCDNSLCVNPAHLRWGTQRENIADRDRRGHTARGSRQPNSKIAEADVPSIRALVGCGRTLTAVGAAFGVDRAIIRRIISGKSWRHVA